MTNDLALPLAQAREYAERAVSANTRRAYDSAWADFVTWCALRQVGTCPAAVETLAAYVSDLARRVKPGTIKQRLAAIHKMHLAAGQPSPVRSEALKLVLTGIRRTHGTAEQGKTPLTVDQLRAVLLAIVPARQFALDGLTDLAGERIDIRDRALLLLGFTGAFRRSELVGIDVEHLGFGAEGMTIWLPRAKTDQEGQGERVAIPYGAHHETDAAGAVKNWLAASGTWRGWPTGGPLFRPVDRHGRVINRRLSPRAVALVVKKRVEAAGFDPDQYAGHSLRSGLATSAAAAHVAERDIMRQTRHRRAETVRRYIRHATMWHDNAAGLVGL